ncbi:MAG: GIY-YIG nuclease family protein [Romboutsia sp.]|uniref:GIY-YIG nuclease family protein n=1 Tax=Romboutsia sp. TaxID=1965302 RepID=UPI003F343C37
MKSNFNLANFKTKWIKYSDYEIKVDKNNEKYIIPKEYSNYTIYNPFEVSDKLLFDLIDLGDEGLKKEPNEEIINKKALLFAKNYGLLGLVSSSVYNRNIIGEDIVIFTENNIITKQNIMDSEDYLKLFLPFATEYDVYTKTYDNHLTVMKAEDSPKFYGKRPLVLDIVFSKFYSEKLMWIVEFSKLISTHLNQLIMYRNINLTEPVTIMADKFKAQKISFNITMFDKAEINWEFDSLESTIETIYAFVLTDEKIILNRCEYCNKAFIGKSEREKYCSPSCRNCTNVIKSRNKKRLLKEENSKKREMVMSNVKSEKRKEIVYEYKEKKTTGGVYKITNSINGKSLIKSEIDLKSMENRFKFSVSTNSCINPKMQKDWKEFGGKAYIFEVLEEVEMKSEMSNIDFKNELKNLEEKYISQVDKENLY